MLLKEGKQEQRHEEKQHAQGLFIQVRIHQVQDVDRFNQGTYGLDDEEKEDGKGDNHKQGFFHKVLFLSTE